jgi:hypothetical protein
MDRMYLAVALFFITNLFSLYRLSKSPLRICNNDQADITDWWPKRLGGKTSYALSWSLTLAIGLTAHHLDLFKMRERRQGKDKDQDSGADELDWERKSKSHLWMIESKPEWS